MTQTLPPIDIIDIDFDYLFIEDVDIFSNSIVSTFRFSLLALFGIGWLVFKV